MARLLLDSVEDLVVVPFIKVRMKLQIDARSRYLVWVVYVPYRGIGFS